MSAILFGSISTLADTSELQRKAFNEAFQAHGLDWRWDRDAYLGMLDKSGGQARIAEYAGTRGQSVDAKAIHDTKSKIFQESLTTSPLEPRPGVVETISSARRNGVKVGLVTTTSPDNVSALITALSPDVQTDNFDVIVDSSSVDQAKPDKAAYSFALKTLAETTGACVAVEDNVDGLRAAVAAGLTCVAFPNENTTRQEFGSAQRVQRLDFEELQHLITA